MKQITNYITEKFKINSKTISKYSFKEVDKPKTLSGFNWLLNPGYFKIAHYLLDYALENCILRKNEEKFIKDFIKDIEKYSNKDNGSYNEETEILNGKEGNGKYQRVKCIYDIAKFYLDTKSDVEYIDKDDVENIIFDLENITNDKIQYLDWAYNEKD